MNIIQYDLTTGFVTSICYCENPPESFLENMLVFPNELDAKNPFKYVVNPATKEIVEPDSSARNLFSLFSFESKTWVLDKSKLTDEISKIINIQRAKQLQERIVFEGGLFDSDEAAVTNIHTTLTVCANGLNLPQGFFWRDANNNNVSMSFEKLKGLAQAIFERNAQIYAESWALKDSLASKTDEELLAIYNDLINK